MTNKMILVRLCVQVKMIFIRGNALYENVITTTGKKIAGTNCRVKIASKGLFEVKEKVRVTLTFFYAGIILRFK